MKYLFFFLLTLVATTLSGSEWVGNVSVLSAERPLTWVHFLRGFHFSLPFLFALTCHEFGHYFVARAYRVTTTLPIYLPCWLGFLGSPSIGTLGAFIRIRGTIRSTRQYFDIGIAGPLAGFLVALGILYYGFTHLPSVEYIFEIHPEYLPYGMDYPKYVYEKGRDFALGDNLLFYFFRHHVAPADAYMPPPQEWVHYPYVFSGFLVLFFTALNLFPIGQLDGGHVLYGLLGGIWHRRISKACAFALIFYAGLGFVHPHPLYEILVSSGVYALLLYLSLHFVRDKRRRMAWVLGIFLSQYGTLCLFPDTSGYQGWVLFSLLVGRFLGVNHPPAQQERTLSLPRRLLGWLAFLIFLLCFSPRPFVLE